MFRNAVEVYSAESSAPREARRGGHTATASSAVRPQKHPAPSVPTRTRGRQGREQQSVQPLTNNEQNLRRPQAAHILGRAGATMQHSQPDGPPGTRTVGCAAPGAGFAPRHCSASAAASASCRSCLPPSRRSPQARLRRSPSWRSQARSNPGRTGTAAARRLRAGC